MEPTSKEERLGYLGFQLFMPGLRLRPYVSAYWYFRRDTPLLTPHEEYMHPQGGYGIGFNLGDPQTMDGQLLVEPIFLDGATTISRKMSFSGQIEQIGINFYAGGAFPFLGIPLAELRNEVALLAAIERPSLLALYGRLYDAKSLPARIRLLEGWLLKRLALGKARDPLIPASLAALRQSESGLSIPNLAEQFAIGQRQLERLFNTQVGMTPRQYRQLLRVEKARLALKQISGSTTDLAMELGFYDQSHFIHEFTAVVGMTPYAYLQRSRQQKIES